MNSIEICDKLTISTKTGYLLNQSYASIVAEVLGENLFLINAPLYKGNIIKFPVEKEYVFVFYNQNGLLQTDGTILEYCVQNKVTLVKIRTKEFNHIQRREFYRVNTSMPFSFTVMKNSEDDPITHFGVVNNISGNGLRFTSSVQLDVNDHVVFNLPLESSITSVEGIILYKEIYEVFEHTFEYRVKLVNLQRAQQEKIVKYVMKKERGIIMRKQIESDKRN